MLAPFRPYWHKSSLAILGDFSMTDESSLRQRQVAGFLIGFGIGLVLGIVFQPPSDDHKQALPGGDKSRFLARAEIQKSTV